MLVFRHRGLSRTWLPTSKFRKRSLDRRSLGEYKEGESLASSVKAPDVGNLKLDTR